MSVKINKPKEVMTTDAGVCSSRLMGNCTVTTLCLTHADLESSPLETTHHLARFVPLVTQQMQGNTWNGKTTNASTQCFLGKSHQTPCPFPYFSQDLSPN